MERNAKRRQKQNAARGREHPWVTAEPGLVLLDSSLKPIACNREAVAILSYAEGASRSATPNLKVPPEILEKIRAGGVAGRSVALAYFRAGRREYISRAYSLDSQAGGLPARMVALLLIRNSSAIEMINRTSAQFNLTDRERETLEGISRGLSSKEVAEEMNISPNTVRAYLRLIMVKMQVGTRAGVVAKILEHDRLLDRELDPIQRLQLAL